MSSKGPGCGVSGAPKSATSPGFSSAGCKSNVGICYTSSSGQYSTCVRGYHNESRWGGSVGFTARFGK